MILRGAVFLTNGSGTRLAQAMATRSKPEVVGCWKGGGVKNWDLCSIKHTEIMRKKSDRGVGEILKQVALLVRGSGLSACWE
jgi:hypothetical protein